MPRSRNETITCLQCDNGVDHGHPCKVCGGCPTIDYPAFYTLVLRADALLAQNMKLHRQIKKLERHNGETDRIVAQYLRGVEREERINLKL